MGLLPLLRQHEQDSGCFGGRVEQCLHCLSLQVFVRAPMALELRVKDTLEPRAAFLRDVLSLSSGALGKLIVRHPQVRPGGVALRHC